MAFNPRLTGLISMVALAGVTPALAKEETHEPSTNHVQSIETSYVQKTWGYVGTGVDYLGKGTTLVGEGISWGFDKSMVPIRKTGEVAKGVGDTLAKGPEWVEGKTGIPMETAASVLRFPGKTIFSLTDNSSDLLKDLPKASLGMVGSTLNLTGHSLAIDTNGITHATKNLGSHTLSLGTTVAGDAFPIGLQAVGFMTGVGGLPYDAAVRDGLAAAHRTTDLFTGQTDLSKPVPQNVFFATKYTYDRITEGKASADAKGGSFFGVSTPSKKEVADTKLSPEMLKAMQNKLVHGG